MKRELPTKVVIGDFKGNPIFSVFEFDGEEQAAYPLVSFGIKKAKALLEHLDEMKEWITQQEKHKL